ncbi:MAG: hypothetical protein GF364_07510, partial [Candidatus Lokiarchaeota archaeon]|nr:hypothetical protein [Candidatus Lokiarchaeota archaeon]
MACWCGNIHESALKSGVSSPNDAEQFFKIKLEQPQNAEYDTELPPTITEIKQLSSLMGIETIIIRGDTSKIVGATIRNGLNQEFTENDKDNKII